MPTKQAEPLTIEARDQFRKVLAEYDIVATGIKSLGRQLASNENPIMVQLAEQLRTLEQIYCLDRESMWSHQTSNGSLSTLIHELSRRGNGKDPIAELSLQLLTLKNFLTPLSIEIENKIERSRNIDDIVVEEKNIEKKKENLERVAYELVMGRTRLRSMPLRHMLDTTSRCNLRCLTCYQSVTQEMVHYDLSDAPYEILFPAFAYAKQIFVQGMGETFLSRSAFPLIAAAKSSGAFVEAITNGTTLERGSPLLQAIDMLMISVDGGTADAYNLVRKNARFDKLLASISALPLTSRGKICFNVVVCKQNIYTMEKCVELGIELNIGHIHFQEMNGYLPWHDKMLIDEDDRSWFFGQLPQWKAKAAKAGISVYCNLVPAADSRPSITIDIDATTARNATAVANIQPPPMPRRATLEEISTELEAFLRLEPPAIFRAIKASFRQLAKSVKVDSVELENAWDAEPKAELDWRAARDRVEADEARFPHCLSTYAHFVVNGDGTTRSCCKVQNRLADISQGSFGEIWNSNNYVALRSAHAQQIAPADPCHDCRDPVRFHFIDEILSTLSTRGIDISLIRKPKDFPLPSTYAQDPLVSALGSNSLEE